MKTIFSDITTGELFRFVYSEDLLWQGTNNGDDTGQYQGRQAIKVGAALILAGRELSAGVTELSDEDAKDLFFDVIRSIDKRSTGSGNSGFSVEYFSNHWKMMHN